MYHCMQCLHRSLLAGRFQAKAHHNWQMIRGFARCLHDLCLYHLNRLRGVEDVVELVFGLVARKRRAAYSIPIRARQILADQRPVAL